MSQNYNSGAGGLTKGELASFVEAHQYRLHGTRKAGRVKVKTTKPPVEPDKYDLERIEKARLKRERRNQKRLAVSIDDIKGE